MLRVLGALGAGIVVAIAAGSLGLHSCDRGIAVQQWAIPALCLAAAIAFIGPTSIRRWLAGALGIVAIATTLHYSVVVHGERYVGHDRPVHLDADAVATGHPAWHTPVSGLYVLP